MLCLARKERYLICVQGVSITQRHTADASGPRDQLGPARHTAPQSAKMEAHWEHWGGGINDRFHQTKLCCHVWPLLS